MSFQNRLSITIPKDNEGFIGRECPTYDAYFKIKLGTGLTGTDLKVHCPYCGYEGEQSDFNTRDQLEYAKSIAINEFQKSLGGMLRNWGKDLERSTRGGFIQFNVEYKENPQPIQYYREKKLETRTMCSNCTLEYSIFGLFAFCPDCGIHNSIQIFNQNMELATKEISISIEYNDEEFRNRLVEDALQSVVSAFDGFGRVLCLAVKEKAKYPEKIEKISFQNIQKAQSELLDQFDCDLSTSLSVIEWVFVTICFQKRHLLVHKLGVVDDEYLHRTNDKTISKGKRIKISMDEALKFINLVQKIGNDISVKLK